MKKKIFGKQLSRDTNERKALFKGLINSLVMEESITTTKAKAQAIRGEVEKLITKAKRKGEASRPLLQPWLQAPALEKVMTDLAVRFASRPGGYTRTFTLGERFGDNATMAVIEFVEKKEKEVKGSTVSKKETKNKKEVVKAEVKVASKTSSKSSKKEEKDTKATKKPTKDSKRKEATAKRNTKKGSK